MISFKLILGVLYGLLVACIVVWGVVSYQNNETAAKTAHEVRRTHEVIERTDEITSLFKDLQLESQAFVITGDSTLLRSYLEARKEIFPAIEKLKKLSFSNRLLAEQTDSLLMLVTSLVTHTNTSLVNVNGPYTADGLRESVITSFRYREDIRRSIEFIKAEEERLLSVRQQAHERSIAAFRVTFLLLMGGIAVLLATTFFSIRYNFNKRMRAQEDLRKATELFTKLFYESPMGIVISQLDTGKIMDCNNAYTELIKYSKTELIGRSTVELGILSTPHQRSEIIDHARANGVARDIEIQLKPKNSEPIWVSKSMQLIKIDNEDCILSAVLDMTVHKEAEQKIKRALESEIELNKLKSNFVTLASHEFRTPLTTILSSAFLVENYSLGENKEKVKKHVARIKSSVNLLTSILDEFLSLTKIEEGKVERKKERINLKQTLEELCQNFRMFARPGQTISYTHSGDEEVVSDPVLLGNIVNNLVSNAIKYSNDDGEIVVSSAVNAKVHISVKDHGIGISKDDQAHLFERFFRASNTGNIQGTGLGLHIMKHYVDMLNGSIDVQSEPGKGSEFKITFDQA